MCVILPAELQSTCASHSEKSVVMFPLHNWSGRQFETGHLAYTLALQHQRRPWSLGLYTAQTAINLPIYNSCDTHSRTQSCADISTSSTSAVCAQIGMFDPQPNAKAPGQSRPKIVFAPPKPLLPRWGIVFRVLCLIFRLPTGLWPQCCSGQLVSRPSVRTSQVLFCTTNSCACTNGAACLSGNGVCLRGCLYDVLFEQFWAKRCAIIFFWNSGHKQWLGNAIRDEPQVCF